MYDVARARPICAAQVLRREKGAGLQDDARFKREAAKGDLFVDRGEQGARSQPIKFKFFVVMSSLTLDQVAREVF